MQALNKKDPQELQGLWEFSVLKETLNNSVCTCNGLSIALQVKKK